MPKTRDSAPSPAPAIASDAKPITPHGRLLRRFRRMAIVGVVLYVVYAAALFAFQDTLIYPRFLLRDERSAPLAPGVTRLDREIAAGEKVHAWLLMPTRERDHAARLVVFFHGNGESAGSNIAFVRHYRDAGFAVLIPEYRGYAGAAGTPLEAGIVDDAVWFVDRARRDPRVDDQRLVLHGRSLGGGVAAQVALKRPPGALILQSSFTSVASFARGKLVPEFLVRSPYRTDAALRTLECPVLILHGTEDTIVPVAHARANAKIARHATLVEMPGGHNDFPHDESAYWKTIDAFLASAN